MREKEARCLGFKEHQGWTLRAEEGGGQDNQASARGSVQNPITTHAVKGASGPRGRSPGRSRSGPASHSGALTLGRRLFRREQVGEEGKEGAAFPLPCRGEAAETLACSGDLLGCPCPHPLRPAPASCSPSGRHPAQPGLALTRETSLQAPHPHPTPRPSVLVRPSGPYVTSSPASCVPVASPFLQSHLLAPFSFVGRDFQPHLAPALPMCQLRSSLNTQGAPLCLWATRSHLVNICRV